MRNGTFDLGVFSMGVLLPHAYPPPLQKYSRQLFCLWKINFSIMCKCKHQRFPGWSWRSFRRNWWRTSGEVWKEIFELLLLGKSVSSIFHQNSTANFTIKLHYEVLGCGGPYKWTRPFWGTDCRRAPKVSVPAYNIERARKCLQGSFQGFCGVTRGGQQQFVGRHLVGVWIGGVWNGHFPESEKYFSEAEFSRKIPKIPQKERFSPNFRLRNLKIQSPKKCNSIPPAIPYPH